MDREIPSVPITTLAGVASLTDLLPEMPLPTPSPQTLSNKSLLFHPRVAEEAQNLLGVRDETLVPQLVDSLIQTSAEHIEVKDNYAGTETKVDQQESMPELLRAMLDRNPNMFCGSSSVITTTTTTPTTTITSSVSNPNTNTNSINSTTPTPTVLQQWNHSTSTTTQSQVATTSTTAIYNQRSVTSIPSALQTPLSPSSLKQPQSVAPSNTLTTPNRPSVITEKPIPPSSSPLTNCNISSLTVTAPQSTPPFIESQKQQHPQQQPQQQQQQQHQQQTENNQQNKPIGTAEQLRQLRRPKGNITPSTRTNNDTSSSLPSTEQNLQNFNEIEKIENKQILSTSAPPSASASSDTENSQQAVIKQPIVKLDRLSVEDQLLMQKSLSKFVETRPKLAKELGITAPKSEPDSTEQDNNNSESETEHSTSVESPRKRNKKRNYNEDDDDFVPDTFSALVSSNRKRKASSQKEEKPEPVVIKPKLRRVEKKFVPVLEKLSQEELMETNTYLRFNKSIEHVLKSAEDIDMNEIMEDGMIQKEHLLSRAIMQELCTEAAKLKILGAMEMIPTDKLVRLLNVLELNIRGGDRVSPITDEDNESIRQLWLETAMERVMLAVDACLICLYIMTSSNMPKRVYLEEVIDRVVLFIKYHLRNTIFPSFDSTYRLDNKKKDGRKKKSAPVLEKSILVLYTKISELVNLLAELLNIQVLTDTSVLHASSMGVSPFFAENVSELQLASLKLVTTIFTRYESHRRLLLDDILASIARLPSTKRSLRTYRLNSEEHIQMLTALVLQLIQCVVALPENFSNKNSIDGLQQQQHQTTTTTTTTNTSTGGVTDNVKAVDKDVLIHNKYDKALSTATTFIAVFLNKCGSKSEDIDYRPLFENFVQDLLSTVNKPEWPATEVLLTLLGKMLVHTFSNKGTDVSLRVASLDYLGVVAARLRRDSVLSRCKLDTIDQMIKDIKSEEMKDSDELVNMKKKNLTTNTEEERTQFLQRVLLDFLAVNAQNDEAYKYARHFYITQWYKDAINEKSQIAAGAKDGSNINKNSYRDRDHHHRNKKRGGGGGGGESQHQTSDNESDDERSKNKSNDQDHTEKFKAIEEKKKFLISKIRPFQETISSGNRVQIFQTYIDYNSAELIAQYLASKRNFSQSFDLYLKAILIVLKETSIAIRTKAMKCLTMIVEADPSVLGRHDMQMGVNHSFLDHSTSVREAAVDLVGKFVLSRPELIDKYYEMLSTRILDTGVSVRKRVIKILKDICIECPEFPKIPEICVKMIRRVNDEEGIRKLVMEVFQNMWFTPTKDTSLLRKVMNITDVVASSRDIGLEWFEQLLLSLFKPKEDKEDSTKVQTEPPKALLLACRQIVDCLIENVLRLEETNDSSGSSQRLVACLTTLHLFAKIRPQLLVKHASTLQPYLGLKCQSAGDIQIISSVARMLELVVPLMDHPSDSFLAQLEEDAMKLVLQQERPIVSSCLSCLGAIINKVTRNYQLIRDCFKRYNDFLNRYKRGVETNNFNTTKCKGHFRRALFTVGLLLRYFDFKDPDVIGDLPLNIKDQVYQNMIYFLQRDDTDIQAITLQAIGCICIRHYEFMLELELKNFYHKILTSDDAPLSMKTGVLINIETYLIEEENRMIQQDLEWSKRSKEENLKEMGDVSSGMASTVIQLYLKEILQSYLHHDLRVRQPALKVIQLVLQQGLVHPVQIVPYLVCMSTDSEKIISHSADKQLLEIEKKYPGFIHTKSSLGIMLSYQLQKILQQGNSIVRGFRPREASEYPSALNGYLYSILRNSRQQRRALILNILKQFDEQVRTSLSYMLYLADNLAYCPYMVQDEPLFIVHHIDIMISVSGTNLLQSFREGLILNDSQKLTIDSENGNNVSTVVSALDEDDDDEDVLVSRVPEDTRQLQAYLTTAQGCLLLLMLKQHLKDIYGLSDGKIQQYSPSEPAKVYEKTASRRSNVLFNPKGTIQKLKEGNPPEYLDEEGRRDLIRQYLDFKQLMLKLDPEDPDDEENAKVLSALSSSHVGGTQQGAATSILTEADQIALENYKDNSTPKVPKLVISSRRLDSDSKRTPRSQRTSEKLKKHRHKKKRRKFVSSSGDESENDYSDPDFMA